MSEETTENDPSKAKSKQVKKVKFNLPPTADNSDSTVRKSVGKKSSKPIPRNPDLEKKAAELVRNISKAHEKAIKAHQNQNLTELTKQISMIETYLETIKRMRNKLVGPEELLAKISAADRQYSMIKPLENALLNKYLTQCSENDLKELYRHIEQLINSYERSVEKTKPEQILYEIFTPHSKEEMALEKLRSCFKKEHDNIKDSLVDMYQLLHGKEGVTLRQNNTQSAGNSFFDKISRLFSSLFAKLFSPPGKSLVDHSTAAYKKVFNKMKDTPTQTMADAPTHFSKK